MEGEKEGREMVGVYRKPYDEEFKRNSVEMLVQSGKAMSVIARELGITPESLRKWKERKLGRTGGKSGETFLGPAGLSASELAEENRRLRKELERVSRQRDILKKAAGILSEGSPGGMP